MPRVIAMRIRHIVALGIVAVAAHAAAFAAEPGGAESHDALVAALRAAYNAGDAKALTALYHATDKERAALDVEVGRVLSTRPLIDAVRMGQKKFGAEAFEEELGRIGFQIGILAKEPGYVNPKHTHEFIVVNGKDKTLFFHEPGNETPVDALQVIDIGGRWYATAYWRTKPDAVETGNKLNAERPKLAAGMREAVEGSSTLAEFIEQFRPHFKRYDRI